MNEISRLSDRTNSQEGILENRSRQNSDGFHRRLAGLDGAESMLTGPMDPGASTSGSKNDVGHLGDELEGVRRKSNEERELDRKFNNYIQGIARNSKLIIDERNKYYKFKEELFHDQKLSGEKCLKLIEQYVEEKIEQPVEEPKQKSDMRQFLKGLVKQIWNSGSGSKAKDVVSQDTASPQISERSDHSSLSHYRNCFSDQESSTLQRTAVEAQSEQDGATSEEISTHKLDFNNNKEQKELHTRLNKLLENNNDIRLEILKLLKEEIGKVSDTDERKGIINNWTSEIDEYLRPRATVSICQDVMNDIGYCYTNGKAPKEYCESLSRQKEIKDAVNEIRNVLYNRENIDLIREGREIMRMRRRMRGG